MPLPSSSTRVSNTCVTPLNHNRKPTRVHPFYDNSIPKYHTALHEFNCIMLAARDQENLSHAHRAAAAAKPLNQGIRALQPKTPGNLKTPFRAPRNDENRPFELNGQKGLLKDGPSKLDKSAFVTPLGRIHHQSTVNDCKLETDILQPLEIELLWDKRRQMPNLVPFRPPVPHHSPTNPSKQFKSTRRHVVRLAPKSPSPKPNRQRLMY